MAQLLTVKHPQLKTDLHPVVQSYEGFRHDLTVLEAKVALVNSPVYSHLILPANTAERFVVVFVGHDGRLEHDFIKVIDREKAIFKNGGWSHVGALVKVIRDVMDCPMNIPLPSLEL